MRQAIVKYLGPTDTRGSRVRARAQAGTIIVGWDHGLNPDENHARAAMALAKKLGWDDCKWAGGALPSGGYAFVCADDEVSP